MATSDAIRAHAAEEAVRRASATTRDAADMLALAGLRLLGHALPARFLGAGHLRLTDYHGTSVPAQITGTAGEVVKTFSEIELLRDPRVALLSRAVNALSDTADDVWLLWDGATDTDGAGTSVDLVECARVLREVALRSTYTVVGTWSRPEQVPGCQEREPVDDFVERVEACTAANAARIALERQTDAHPQEAAPADAGYGMEPRVIAVFPLGLWPASI